MSHWLYVHEIFRFPEVTHPVPVIPLAACILCFADWRLFWLCVTSRDPIGWICIICTLHVCNPIGCVIMPVSLIGGRFGGSLLFVIRSAEYIKVCHPIVCMFMFVSPIDWPLAVRTLSCDPIGSLFMRLYRSLEGMLAMHRHM